jgi:hypothetical protein
MQLKEMIMSKCALCGGEYKEGAIAAPPPPLQYRVRCPRCGEYVITDDALYNLPTGFIKQHIHLLSAVARHYWERKQTLRIDTGLLQDRAEFEAKILSQCPQRIQEKMDAILLYVAEKSKCAGHEVQVVRDEDYPLVYCKNGLEMGFLLENLRDRKLINLHDRGGPCDVTLTADGWTKVEELDKPNIESKQAFVAMWFDKQLEAAYKEGIAQLEQDTGFSMMRIDMKEFNDKVCDHIITEIRRSRFMIADVTRHRRAVYFEAGYAMGLGLPVIWTCREDQVKKIGYNFDTRQYKHIVWKAPQDLREQLKYRILATIDNMLR